MARVRVCGFETGDLRTESPGATSGSVAIESSIVRTGGKSAKVTPASGAAGWVLPMQNISINGNNQSKGYRVCVRVTSLPSATRVFWGNSVSGVSRVRVRLKSTGALEILDGAGTLLGTSTTTLTDTARWYVVETLVSASLASGPYLWSLRIDGSEEVSAASTSDINSVGMTFQLGSDDTVAATYTAYFDDLASDDAGYPGDGRVVHLLPTSDNTRTNWTAGAGGTTSLFDAVNNVPPAGLASASETNTSNIESASSTGTATYIANTATYQSAGIRPWDKILAAGPIIRHGEDIATGTKTGSFQATNPTVSAQTFTFGNDAGAHAGEIASTWLTELKLTDSPSVTYTTVPTVQVTKTDTGTRTACVDYMAMQVEYLPGHSPYMLQTRQAVNRSASF